MPPGLTHSNSTTQIKFGLTLFKMVMEDLLERMSKLRIALVVLILLSEIWPITKLAEVRGWAWTLGIVQLFVFTFIVYTVACIVNLSFGGKPTSFLRYLMRKGINGPSDLEEFVATSTMCAAAFIVSLVLALTINFVATGHADSDITQLNETATETSK